MERTENFFRLHPTFPLSRNWCLTLSGAGREGGRPSRSGEGKVSKIDFSPPPFPLFFGNSDSPHLRFPLLPYYTPKSFYSSVFHRVVICSTTYFHSKNDGKFGAVPIAL